jgi:hypothetical protein
VSLIVSCACGASWTGTRIAHCKAAGCHRTFSTAANFDKHWRGRGDDRHCVDPATVGLVPREHSGCVVWSKPREDVSGRPVRVRGSRDTGQGGFVALSREAAPANGNQGEVVQ